MGASHSAPIWLAGVFILVGATVVALSLGMIPADPGSFHAPMWVITCVGLVFMIAGAMVYAKLYWDAWVNHALAAALVGLMGVTCSWVAFGPGERSFSSSFGADSLRAAGEVGASTGRIVFAVSSVLVWAVFLLAITHAVKSFRSRVR